MKYLITAALLSGAALFLAFAQPSPIGPEPNIGVGITIDFPGKNPSAQQKTCMAQEPKQDCSLSLATRNFFQNNLMFMSVDSDITYHNDNVGGSDGSVDLFLKNGLLQTPASNPYLQHTHGPAHTLFVMTRRRVGNQCKPELKAYPLAATDEIRIYHGGRTQPMMWNSNQNLPALPHQTRIQKVKRNRIQTLCDHTSSNTLADYWEIDAPPMQLADPNANNPNLPPTPQQPPQIRMARYRTTGPTYLRRILIRNGNTNKHLIKLESGCSSWAICVRPPGASCETVPLCALRLVEQPACSC